MTETGPVQTSTREVYRNRWMRVREDSVRFPDGADGLYGVVEKPDFALVVPLHADGRLQLVEQFRYPVGERFWEFPQGSWETRPDASPEEVAAGELTEETGFTATRLERIGHLYEAYGFCNQGFHAFLATGLQPGEARKDAEEQDMRTQAFDLDEVKGMVASGQIKDAPTVATLALLMMSGALYW